MKKQLIEKTLWNKYSPMKIEDMIMLPRIKDILQRKGTGSNLILYGHFGTGKSTLAKILCTGKNLFYRNARIHTSIEVVRSDLQFFVDTVGFKMGVDINEPKYVYLEEFEKTSKDFQEALKAFMDENEDVRFIFTTNYINKVDGGIISRCTSICFDPLNSEEIKFMKLAQLDRLKFINDTENLGLNIDGIKQIIKNKFPDMRSMIEALGVYQLTNTLNIDSDIKMEIDNNLYPYLLKNKFDLIALQNYVVNTFGDQNIHKLLEYLGRPLIEYLINNDKSMLVGDGLGKIYNCVAEHTFWLNSYNGGDPIVLGVSCLSKIFDIIKNK